MASGSANMAKKIKSNEEQDDLQQSTFIADEKIYINETALFVEALTISLISKKKTIFVGADEKLKELLQIAQMIAPASKWTTIRERKIEFTPGTILGGRHTIETGSIPLGISFLMLVGVFAKDKSEIELKGCTNDKYGITDMYEHTYGFIHRIFNIKSSIKLSKRGFYPEGQGIVQLQITPLRGIQQIVLSEEDKFEKIKGIINTSRIGSDFAIRMATEMNKRMKGLPKIKISTVINNKSDSGPTPGFSAGLFTKSYKGIFYSMRWHDSSPEKLVKEVVREFLKSIEEGGAIDQKLAGPVLLLMGLADGIGKILFGGKKAVAEQILKMLQMFIKFDYKLEKIKTGLLITIVGANMKNLAMPR
ncbi:RNA 3'-terminal phosphate cyclase-like protein [Enteropsectra breve]|nr:RNA 3'-terminal phosphate cyclase-like protein [Enteropsectra breve]KAI5150288.1 RNA 3'-terminal phosphate cyclase-like protein [Enteropsectra breve]